MVHEDHEEVFDFVRYRARISDAADLRAEGRWRLRTGDALEPVHEKSFLTGVLGGVGVWHHPSYRAASCGPENRANLEPYSFPGLITGLGRGMDFTTLRDRADLLSESVALTVEHEDSSRVVLSGRLREARRTFDHRIEIDPACGHVLRHDFFNPVWGHRIASWSMPERTTIDGVSVPRLVTYTVASAGITPADQETLNRRKPALGIPPGPLDPDAGYFPAWVRLRREHFASTGGAPPLTNLTRQSATVHVILINPIFTPDDFRVEPPEPPRVTISTAFGGLLRAPSIDPADAIPTPQRPDPDPKEAQ
ncbi:MAG: hypothetical protein HRU70_05520 [Phycisphaeraceae bacterium]|nr:MAG: hypothetical protein HRU70_05520 [Phycisphaeraceae bacterium]